MVFSPFDFGVKMEDSHARTRDELLSAENADDLIAWILWTEDTGLELDRYLKVMEDGRCFMEFQRADSSPESWIRSSRCVYLEDKL